MARSTLFACSTCGREEPKWLGHCPDCGEWNTFEPRSASLQPGRASRRRVPSGSDAGAVGGAPTVQSLGAISADDAARLSCANGELERALGGGFVPGSTTLLGGDPGVGKSTLTLQLAAAIARDGRTVLYASAEESPAQLRLRAGRLGLADADIDVWAGTDVDDLLDVLEQRKPAALIVDSLQTMQAAAAGLPPGGVAANKYVCTALAEWTRRNAAVTVLVAHVTKEGTIAGPRAVEHLVDVVLYLETAASDLRLVRASKNRFGPADEVGLLEMGTGGLGEVGDASSRFLVHRDGQPPPGVIVAPVYEGSRVLLVELQSLTTPAKASLPRVYADRIDMARINRLTAVLERHVGADVGGQDVYVNVAGGIRLRDVAADLPLALSIYSALVQRPLAAGAAAFGELSLAGEVRPVVAAERRLRALAQVGCERITHPGGDVGPAREGGPSRGTAHVRTVAEAVAALR